MFGNNGAAGLSSVLTFSSVKGLFGGREAGSNTSYRGESAVVNSVLYVELSVDVALIGFLIAMRDVSIQCWTQLREEKVKKRKRFVQREKKR